MSLRLIIITLPILLASCATHTGYRAQQVSYDHGRETSYFQAQLAPAIAATSPEPLPQDSAIAAIQQRWKALLAPPAASPASSTTSDDLAKGIDLNILTDLLATQNPSIRAARGQLQATLEQFTQTEQLDTLLSQVTSYSRQLDTAVGPTNHRPMVARRFPYPDTSALKGKLIDQQAQIARTQVQIATRDAVAELKTAYYQLIYTDAALLSYSETKELLTQTIRVAQSRMRTTDGGYNAVIMAQVELAKLTNDINNLEQDRQSTQAAICTLIGLHPEHPLGPPAPVTDQQLSGPLEDLYAQAITTRQELQAKRLEIDRLQTMVELSTRMTHPDPGLNASLRDSPLQPLVMPKAPGASAARSAMLMGQSDAYSHEIAARATAQKAALSSLEDRTRLAVRDAHIALTTAHRSIALYQQSILPQAQQSLDAATTAFRAGKLEFLAFLEAERSLLSYRLDEQRAWRDYRTALAKLEQIIGEPPPTAPISDTAKEVTP